ncbi:unnamed protein product [Haemonchus placei]|uniref:Secreted protein n=1 Tax=Haemonchus placei TaxID=6290 RepID=A0A0N4W680_HAEPC|nr:unnamed protein product [Haemonchus placei]
MRATLLGLICIVGLVTTKNGTDPFDVKPPFRRCFVNEEFTKCGPLCQPKCGQTKPVRLSFELYTDQSRVVV